MSDDQVPLHALRVLVPRDLTAKAGDYLIVLDGLVLRVDPASRAAQPEPLPQAAAFDANAVLARIREPLKAMPVEEHRKLHTFHEAAASRRERLDAALSEATREVRERQRAALPAEPADEARGQEERRAKESLDAVQGNWLRPLPHPKVKLFSTRPNSVKGRVETVIRAMPGITMDALYRETRHLSDEQKKQTRRAVAVLIQEGVVVKDASRWPERYGIKDGPMPQPRQRAEPAAKRPDGPTLPDRCLLAMSDGVSRTGPEVTALLGWPSERDRQVWDALGKLRDRGFVSHAQRDLPGTNVPRRFYTITPEGYAALDAMTRAEDEQAEAAPQAGPEPHPVERPQGSAEESRDAEVTAFGRSLLGALEASKEDAPAPAKPEPEPEPEPGVAGNAEWWRGYRACLGGGQCVDDQGRDYVAGFEAAKAKRAREQAHLDAMRARHHHGRRH